VSKCKFSFSVNVIVSLRHEPQDEDAVCSAILAARKERESEARPATTFTLADDTDDIV
jgi:hypothetical protein